MQQNQDTSVLSVALMIKKTKLLNLDIAQNAKSASA
jgi:hypothetical protein